ncbi:hypothetical protein QYE76_063142 [Lolium multiflorum]|uniref:Uncharacterized protein n=1 Tax=Lolium multiflorum TaxID=4521 RepID=A0AAD8S4E2_LOLMU|nr:hypothetical protein QYE76_063142 [Lolium multiflorum]
MNPLSGRVPEVISESPEMGFAAVASLSGDEEEAAPIDVTARTSTSRTLVVSEAQPDGDETSPPQQNIEHPTPAVSPQAPSPKRARVEPAKEPPMLIGCSSTPLMEEPFMKELIRFGTKFVGYREYAAKLEEKLAESNKRADALAVKLEQSEKARKKAEADAAAMEPYVQTETYDLENGGSLVFERDLYLVSERLERPPPKFHGVRIHNTPTGEQQWMITADLKGSSEPPISERILFSFKAYSWVDGLAHALQEGLARVCGQNIAALQGSRFAHFARHDTTGEPMALSSHPVLKIHVQHLDFMLHETRKDLELTRVHSHRAQMALAHHADAIRLLAKDRRSLRLQRAKNVATITRLREKIRTLEVTVRTQQDQIQEMEEDGEDIQGGDDFLSDDNDFEDDEFTDEEDYEFLEAAEDGIIPIDVDEDPEE